MSIIIGIIWGFVFYIGRENWKTFPYQHTSRLHTMIFLTMMKVKPLKEMLIKLHKTVWNFIKINSTVNLLSGLKVLVWSLLVSDLLQHKKKIIKWSICVFIYLWWHPSLHNLCLHSGIKFYFYHNSRLLNILLGIGSLSLSLSIYLFLSNQAFWLGSIGLGVPFSRLGLGCRFVSPRYTF